MSTPISGKDGSVKVGGSTAAHIRKFSITRTSENQAWSGSGSPGQVRRVPGRKDWSGSMSIYLGDGDPNEFTLSEGSVFSGEFITTSGHKYSGQAIVDEINTEVDVEEGTLIGAEVKFSADGALTVT